MLFDPERNRERSAARLYEAIALRRRNVSVDLLNNSLNNLLQNADIDVLNDALNNILRNADIIKDVTVNVSGNVISVDVLSGPNFIINLVP